MTIAAQFHSGQFTRADRTGNRAFLGVCVLVFAGSAALTALSCTSMAAMRGMNMPGGWTMSMAWMRMPGQTWAGAATSFLAMWVGMMVAMMLPSVAPTLWRYREALGRTGVAHIDRLTAVVGSAYFLVWTALGAAIFPLGVAVAQAEMRHAALARAVPMATGAVILMAGAFQFTNRKAHHLACCRKVQWSADTRSAWRQGVCLGMHCSYGCAGMTAILLVCGVMDWRAMIVVTAAITVERIGAGGVLATRAIGVVATAVGIFLIAKAGLA